MPHVESNRIVAFEYYDGRTQDWATKTRQDAENFLKHFLLNIA